jgi:D-alanyl-D-alanine carboxypeptidase
MKRSLRTIKRGLPWLVLLLAVVAHGRPAQAQVGSDRYASIVIDAQSGDLLSAANPDEPRYPASLTKMMTIYMLFEALRDRRVSLDQFVPVSAHAAAMMPSKLGLVPGTAITVEQALLGLVTKSANDAASALGELLGGDEDRFAQMMTLRARALGMSHTTFRNASGWPDPEQVTTARDLALLARHLVQDYPAEYRYFSIPSFMYHGRVIPNHDRMLQTYPGADGLKTGYTTASGCNLVTSAVRGDVRLIGVVLGASNGSERDSHMAALLDAGFDRLGVPINREERRQHFPTLVAAASAATLPPREVPSWRAPSWRVPSWRSQGGHMRAVAVRAERWHPEPRLTSLRAAAIERVAPEPRVALHERHVRDGAVRLRPRAARSAADVRHTAFSAAAWGRTRG